MMTQQQLNYTRVEQAITFIRKNFKEQPSLDVISDAINLSPCHFQRLFKDWAGVSPKKFLQYTSIEYSKYLLQNEQSTLPETAHKTGLSGTGRLHDLFVNIERMTPGEYKNGGEGLELNYSFTESPFGKIVIASTVKGVCYIAFYEDKKQAFTALNEHFPSATFFQIADPFQHHALSIFKKDWSQIDKIKLHLNGTPFQLKVWESLLRIPMGNLTSYGSIAKKINSPKAARAVGTAIANNPIAFLIPCHRVIQSNGNLGGYMWGTPRKAAMIGWEAAHGPL